MQCPWGAANNSVDIKKKVPYKATSRSQYNPLLKGEAMSQFDNVSVIKKANVYFDGKVTSRTLLFPDGSKKTLGIMLPGEYEFNTAEKEDMEIISGQLEVLLPGSNDWQEIKGGQSFPVPANSKFHLRIKTLTDYCCSFIAG